MGWGGSEGTEGTSRAEGSQPLLGPYLTEGLPGVGGRLRVEKEDFLVEEVPAYEPCGEGEHTFVGIEKRGISTWEAVERLARAVGVPPKTVGYAGLKDVHAVARQVLSFQGVPPEQLEGLELPGVRVRWARRHRNKLKPGHLRGNRFTIRLRGVVPDAVRRAEPILEALFRRGVPNYYGPQRFGRRGDNHLVGLALLQNDRERLAALGYRRRLSKRERRFFLSAFQSYLFNRYLARRVARGLVDDLLPGDIAKKMDTGGIFIVEDVDAERPRARAFAISATGPIFGYKMMRPRQEAAELEAEVLAEAGLTLEAFRPARLTGLRRPVRYRPEGLDWWQEGEDLVVTFFAPSGSYATALLRELMKPGLSPLPSGPA